MSTRQFSTTLPNARKALRVFEVTYYCWACDSEFTDYMLTVSDAYCPCCDAANQPGTIKEFEEEIDEDDEEDA